MDENKEKRYAQLIEAIRDEKRSSLEMATELFSGDMRDSLAELSLADNHPADIGSELYQRERDIAVRDRLMGKIDAIDAALARWENKEYGICEHCGREIPLERLEALPYTTVCSECSHEEEKEEQHSFHRDPVENEILQWPFSRSFKDDSGKVEFDGEDSWQAVARYGTSDTLQDLGTNRDIDNANDMYEDSDEWIGAVGHIEVIPTEREEGRENTNHSSRKHGTRGEV